MPDAKESDHLTVKIELRTNAKLKRDAAFIKWGAFREDIEAAPPTIPLDRYIQVAIEAATKMYRFNEDSPDPDLLLLNLWAERL